MRTLSLFVTLLGLAAVARATPVPAIEGNAKTAIELSVKRYDGGTNGVLTVEISNQGKASADFNAKGLYFIPSENADDAPQRLGAVGPFAQQLGDGKERRDDKVTLAPGQKATLRLDVYCIDSHRRSPRTGDKFAMATTRMPKELAGEIRASANKAVDSLDGGYAAPAAKSAVQSEVWRARDKKWIRLEGEGKQEATK